MTVRSPFTHEGHELATLLTVQAQLYETIKFLEADKRVQDKIIAARDAEIELLRKSIIQHHSVTWAHNIKPNETCEICKLAALGQE